MSLMKRVSCCFFSSLDTSGAVGFLSALSSGVLAHPASAVRQKQKTNNFDVTRDDSVRVDHFNLEMSPRSKLNRSPPKTNRRSVCSVALRRKSGWTGNAPLRDFALAMCPGLK